MIHVAIVYRAHPSGRGRVAEHHWRGMACGSLKGILARAKEAGMPLTELVHVTKNGNQVHRPRQLGEWLHQTKEKAT